MNHPDWLHWEASGRPVPPPHIVKQWTVIQYSKLFSLKTFIETGTYIGEMIQAVKDSFSKCISIELEPTLYERAKQMFSSVPHVSIIHGDSSEVLPNLLTTIKQPCLFWLDGHWTGGPIIAARGKLETPIRQELYHIFQHSVKDHVILIDDARLFVGENDYPTIEQLREFVKTYDNSMSFQLENDIIRIHR